MSTVVGLATGMFTLRDQVFPRESGTAAAVPASVYEAQVGRVCDDLNDNDRRRAREQRTTRRRLQRASTTVAQRNALLDGVRRTAARSADALAAFTAIEAPSARAVARGETVAAWGRNIARVRGYAVRLDRAGTRGQLLAALDHLSTLRPRLARDGDRVVAGLRRLGAASCDLRPPIVTPAFSLPPLREDEGVASDVSTPAPKGSAPTHVGAAPAPRAGAGVSAAGPEFSADAPSDVSATTPEPDSPAAAAPSPDTGAGHVAGGDQP